MNHFKNQYISKRSYWVVASLFLCIFLIQCGKPNREFLLKVKLNQLKGDQIFDRDLVMDMVFDAHEFGIDSVQRVARQIFLKGLDAYKNKKDIHQAIRLFKESLMYFPEAKTYYELGNALLQFKNNKILLEQASVCFDIAGILSFKPAYMNDVKKAKVAALLLNFDDQNLDGNFKWWEVQNELNQAFLNGYFDTTAIQKDPDLSDFVKSNAYRELIIDYLARQTKGGTLSKFEIFKKSFSNFNPDLQIGEQDVSMEKYRQSISYEFSDFIPEMENVSFGREVSNDFYYVAKLAENENYVALVYASSSFSGEGYQPVETILAVYNAQGKQIARKLIACRCSDSKIKTCSFNSGKIQIEDRKLIWEKPVAEFGLNDNQVKSTELIAKAVFKIEDNGRITTVDLPEAFNDSFKIAGK